MKRRTFIAGLGGAAAWPLAAQAQQPALPVIGFLTAGAPEGNRSYVAGFRLGLSQEGFVEGRNVAIEFRGAGMRLDRLPDVAADLVRRKPAVLFAGGPTAAFAANSASSTIPIVPLTSSARQVYLSKRTRQPMLGASESGQPRKDRGACPRGFLLPALPISLSRRTLSEAEGRR
jgi:ABC-type uncharacterized transport system substrate-binding protein